MGLREFHCQQSCRSRFETATIRSYIQTGNYEKAWQVCMLQQLNEGMFVAMLPQVGPLSDAPIPIIFLCFLGRPMPFFHRRIYGRYGQCDRARLLVCAVRLPGLEQIEQSLHCICEGLIVRLHLFLGFEFSTSVIFVLGNDNIERKSGDKSLL